MASFGLKGPMLECYKLLLRLKKHHYAWPFNQPVDPVALNIPTYFDIIKEPMDLGTVQKNLEQGVYQTPDEFAAHVNLIWNNATTFNPPGHEICIMADTLSKIFDKSYPRIKQNWLKKKVQEGGAKSIVGSTKEEMTNTIHSLRDSMQHVREEIKRLREEKAEEDANREMTWDEKIALSDKINQLTPEQLGDIVRIIEKKMPNLKKNPDDSIEIDLELLDTQTLRACERYVSTSLSPKKSKKRKQSKSSKKGPQTEKGIEEPDVKAPKTETKDNGKSGEKGVSSSSSSESSSDSESSDSDSEKKKQKKNGISLDFSNLNEDQLKEKITQLAEENGLLKEKNSALEKLVQEERKQREILQKRIDVMERTLNSQLRKCIDILCDVQCGEWWLIC